MRGHPRFILTRRARTCGGFTLVELVVVVVIVTIMASVAVPTLSSIPGTRSGMACKQLLRDTTFARQRAMATGNVHWVVFNTTAKTWSILMENPLSPGRSGATTITDMATGVPFTTILGVNEYSGINFTSCTFGSGTQIGFDWLGKPRISDSASLTSQGSAVLTGGHKVTVEAVTGHIAYVP